MKRVTLIMVLAVFGLSTVGLCRTWYIDPHGTGDVPDISTGISYSANGDILLLADGVYTGSGNTGLGYQGKAIVIRSQSGDPHACVIDCMGSSSNHVRGFEFRQRERSGSVLEGVTIRNGYANEGGGVYCWAASPTISNVIFAGNVAVYVGGGLYCGRGSAPVLTNVTFHDNSAAEGGGIYCTYYAAPVVNSSIVSYGGQGGAVVLGGPGNSPSFTCCDIYGNTGGDWEGEISNQSGQSGNISEDPLFCMDANPERPYSLHNGSPCISSTESGCGIMGAGGVGCMSGIEATVDIDPNVLNPKSHRRWLTCYLELPGGQDPREIDVSTVVLNGEVSAEPRPTAVGDSDGDGIADRMVKFSWPDVLASLESFGEVEMEISGHVGGEAFSGTDIVRVLTKDWDSSPFAQGTDFDGASEINVTNPGQSASGFGIQLDLSGHTHVRLAVYDVHGRVVRTLLDEVRRPDVYVIYWDARDASGAGVAPGIYFVSLETAEHRAISKVVVTR